MMKSHFLINFFCSVFLLLFDVNHAFSIDEEMNFKHLWVENGLSQSTVFCIYKDQKNFMWFGTRRGLNRYDGSQFDHFMHNMSDSNSISSNIIYAFTGDNKDNLVIQTSNHLNYYDRYLEKFSIISCDEIFWNFEKDRENNIWACSDSGLFLFDEKKRNFYPVENSHPFDNLYDLAFDNQNNLWITGNSIIIRYNIENANYKAYKINVGSHKSTNDFFITTDKNGKIWSCLRSGELLHYDLELDSFVLTEYIKNQDNLLVTSFNKGLDNSILIGTDGNGLITLDVENTNTEIYNHIPDDKNSLSSNTIYSVFADDKNGLLWLGSYMGGVDYYSRYSKGIRFLYHVPYNEKSIINSNVRSLLVDKENNIWLGTRQGVTVLNQNGEVKMHFNQQKLHDNGVLNPIITEIWQDQKGYIWIFSYKGGVVLYDPYKKELMPVNRVYSNFDIPADLGIFKIIMDSKSNLWLATDAGTYLFPENKKGFVFHELFSKDIIEDRAGRVFLGTAYNGLYHVDLGSLYITPVRFNIPAIENDNLRMNVLFEDLAGNIWIGSDGSGVFIYNPTTQKSKHYTTAMGLPDNNITGIIQDNNKNIWITSYSGISRFIAEKELFRSVFFEDDIKGKEFNPQSIGIDTSGFIYAGSINGLLTFNTKQYKENPYLPEVVFTQLYINNKKILPGRKASPLEQSIMFSDNINLHYNQNNISLNFTAPFYYLNNNIEFYYRFVNTDEPWKRIGNNRTLNFVNMKPGEYLLNIKAANSDGYSDEHGTSVQIYVAPPIWRSIWAYIFYFIVLSGIFLLIRKIIVSRMNLEYEILVQKTEKEKQDEINQARVRLFTDISHEIGTSLTLINIPLETLNRIEDDDFKKNQLAIIDKYVSRLLLLVKKIISVRKIETGNMSLAAERDDIIDFVKSVCSNYEPLAINKGISFIYEFPAKKLITWFDKEKVEFILYDLLSNAFKFEPENGKIWVSISKENGIIKGENRKIVSIKVGNEGSYIPPEQTTNIFKRFYRGSENQFGSGIGLSLIKSYAEIHKGEIRLVSEKNLGVVFELVLPFGEAYLQNDEKKLHGAKYELKSHIYIDAEHEIKYSGFESQKHKNIKILIVEDNIELKNLLKEQLKKTFDIIEAGDGEEGFIKAKNFLPDLVITDLEMPKTDGLELCANIKKDLNISHIPVIILSAKEDVEERIKGIESGADAYITKPFSISYLNSVVFNLIELRRKLKSKYYIGSGQLENEKIDITSLDENFLEKAYRIIENNIDNTLFGIPEFIDQLGVSKYMLYAKIKELAGQTPNEFIMNYRLKKAALILKSKNISDIDLYYKLGFNDVSYFRKCFKKQYGKTPYQYVKAIKFMEEGD